MNACRCAGTTAPCADCGTDTLQACEWYMVRDAVWARAGMGHGYLCVGCLERRIGRRLTASDFTAVPVNGSRYRHSARLESRIWQGVHGYDLPESDDYWLSWPDAA